MKLSMSEIFTGIIWKVETDDFHPVVAIETRDIANRKTHFSAFNYETGECYFKEVSVEESWFWTLDKVYAGVILLHSYINESSPEHKGIIAINLEGNIAWQQFNKTLLAVSTDGLIVYDSKIQPKRPELADVRTGALIRSNVIGYKLPDREILLPQLKSIPEVSQPLPVNTVGPVFYQKYRDKKLLVFHTQTEQLFEQQLAVFQDGELILTDILAGNIQKLNPEAFFIQRNQLMFIRNDKHELVSYLL